MTGKAVQILRQIPSIGKATNCNAWIQMKALWQLAPSPLLAPKFLMSRLRLSTRTIHLRSLLQAIRRGWSPSGIIHVLERTVSLINQKACMWMSARWAAWSSLQGSVKAEGSSKNFNLTIWLVSRWLMKMVLGTLSVILWITGERGMRSSRTHQLSECESQNFIVNTAMGKGIVSQCLLKDSR